MKDKDKIRTIFIGTPDFGIPSLRKLADDSRFEVAAVITGLDKKIGRKYIITPSPIKIEAQKLNLLVLQPQKISKIKKEIADLNPDIIVTVAYGQIIPEEILTIPKFGSINIHGSLLPKYRGSACVQSPILNGDKKSGVTIMLMDKNIDTGPILNKAEVILADDETYASLHKKLSILGAEILIPTLMNYINGKIKPQKQANSQASYTKQLKKQDGHINWNKEAKEIERFIRAMNPWPGAFSYFNDNLMLKIFETSLVLLNNNKYKIGELFLYNNQLAIKCLKDTLIIKKLQIQGKKEISSDSFILGHKKYIGQILK
ncbi:MAG: methionyl-tRNA formyltransferase [Parcubacteria group bacterium]|nr:methionyl-tRNA formyltransferase [Parcubacteria group bacterium]